MHDVLGKHLCEGDAHVRDAVGAQAQQTRQQLVRELLRRQTHVLQDVVAQLRVSVNKHFIHHHSNAHVAQLRLSAREQALHPLSLKRTCSTTARVCEYILLGECPLNKFQNGHFFHLTESQGRQGLQTRT